MSALSDELLNDPLGRGYAAMKDPEVENDMGERRYDVVGLLPIGAVVAILYASGTFDAIFVRAMQGDAMAAGALEKIKTMKALGIESIDCGSEKALADLAAAGVPQEDLAAIRTAATVKKSRAEVLGIAVNATLVAEARV